MSQNVFVYDPTAADELSKVRGIGRYLQILKENFPEWKFTSDVILEQSDRILLSEKPDVFINPFFNFLTRPVVTKRIAKNQIAVIHDLIPLKYPEHFPAGIKGGLHIFANKLALKNYDTIVTDSEASKQDIINILNVDEQKVEIIYPCVPKIFIEHKTWNMEQSMKQKKTDNNVLRSMLHVSSPHCLYVGDVTWNKNLVNIAKAIKIANKPCVFVGKSFSRASNENKWDEEFHEFQQLAKDDKNFIFPGFVDDASLIALYQNARINLLLSRDEGFGFSYLEAASVGCPSVLADIPVLQEISAESALYANPEDPQDIAQKVNTLYKDETIWLQCKKDAKKRSEYFSTEKFKEEFSQLVS